MKGDAEVVKGLLATPGIDAQRSFALDGVPSPMLVRMLSCASDEESPVEEEQYERECV